MQAIERERERDRDRETERDRKRETDRQTDRQRETETERDRETDRERDGQTERQRERYMVSMRTVCAASGAEESDSFRVAWSNPLTPPISTFLVST